MVQRGTLYGYLAKKRFKAVEVKLDDTVAVV